ncbi:MAG: tetratricopeptide repeat protein [Nitrospira sp.]
MGRTYLTLGRLTEASEYLHQASAAARKQNAPPLAATTLNDVGVLLAKKGQDNDALEAFEESVDFAEQATLPLLAATARTNAARALLRIGQPTNSRLSLDAALDLLQHVAPSRHKSLGLIGIAVAYQRLIPHLTHARDALLLTAAGVLQEAAAVAEEQGDKRTLSYAWGYLGHLYETESRVGEALQLTRKALFTAQSVDAPESLYRWQWQVGRLQTATGRLDDAIASYRQAASTLQPIRAEVAHGSSEGPEAAQETVKPMYFELADLLLQRASLTQDNTAAENYLIAARDAIEAYKTAELRDYFKDDCVDAVRSRLTDVGSVVAGHRRDLSHHVQCSAGAAHQFAFRTERISVPVAADRLTQEIREFRRLVEKRTTREYLPHAATSCTTGWYAHWKPTLRNRRSLH